MRKNIKYLGLFTYTILLIIFGYSLVTQNNNISGSITKVIRENIEFLNIFIINYSSDMFLILLCLFGIIGFLATSNTLITLGTQIHIVSIKLNIPIYKLVAVLCIHGIEEVVALIIVLSISVDIITLWYKYLITNEVGSLFCEYKKYIKNKLPFKLFIIFILLFIGSILEYFVSVPIFDKYIL
ncbi:hypothetical protein SAMN05428976_10737 [Clostridium sp. USBA 49]|uniref:stage II sporulation protein M n=1 Tax=Clostridium sp. USBA 49 TaxID=1881060 RepID=UPI00099A2F9C|nr:stage II sporulation protein M [Clostridium sp. USBA 49]SKA85062.1 hypothetical protein SAMN05428976_10737 [Clostridium sp. USBA 49]